MAGKDEHSSEEKSRLIQNVADLMNAFDAGLIEATGIAIKNGGTDKGTGTIARVAYTGANGAQPAEARVEGIEVLHAGTAFKDGRVVTAGGRVLSVSARGEDIDAVAAHAYEAASRIHFDGMQYRRDIGSRARRR